MPNRTPASSLAIQINHIQVLDDEKIAENMPKINEQSTPLFDQEFADLALISSSLFLKKIPREIFLLILSFLKLSSDLNLCTIYARIERSSSTLFRDNLQEARLKQLLQYVVYGNEYEAYMIIVKQPQLLLLRGTAVDYSGRTIEGTPLQMALGAMDIEMTVMIVNYFIRQSNGRDEILKQYNEQFPEDHRQNEILKHTHINALNEVVAAIAASNTDEDCQVALEKFREALKPKGIIRAGKHFDLRLLVVARKLYYAKFNEFGGLLSRKNQIYFLCVLSYIQRFLPAYYAQALSYQVIIYPDRYEKICRSFKFFHDRGDGCSLYYPLDTDKDDRLGYHFGMYDNGRLSWVGHGTGDKNRDGQQFVKYIKQIENEFKDLFKELNNKSNFLLQEQIILLKKLLQAKRDKLLKQDRGVIFFFFYSAVGTDRKIKALTRAVEELDKVTTISEFIFFCQKLLLDNALTDKRTIGINASDTYRMLLDFNNSCETLKKFSVLSRSFRRHGVSEERRNYYLVRDDSLVEAEKKLEIYLLHLKKCKVIPTDTVLPEKKLAVEALLQMTRANDLEGFKSKWEAAGTVIKEHRPKTLVGHKISFTQYFPYEGKQLVNEIEKLNPHLRKSSTYRGQR